MCTPRARQLAFTSSRARTDVAVDEAPKRYFAPVEVRDGVAIIRIDCPGKVNSISGDMRDAAKAIWEREVAPRDDVKAAVFISAKSDNFIAGADIGMLRTFKAEGREDELKQLCMEGHDMFDEVRARARARSRRARAALSRRRRACRRGRAHSSPSRASRSSRRSTARASAAASSGRSSATTASRRRRPRRSSGCPR